MGFPRPRERISYRNINTLQPYEISRIIWLTIDEVLLKAAISRGKLWSLVKDGTLPSPYAYERGALWPSDEIKEFIQQRKEEIHLYNLSHHKNHITWDMIVNTLHRTPNMTNSDISYKLDCNIIDVASLTRVMVKSGSIGYFNATKNSRAKSFFVK